MTRYIFLSPHLDDIVLSCGAIVDHLSNKGHKIEIWTFFAGDPPNDHFFSFALSLHQRWALPNNPILTRRKEDISSCFLLNATPRHFDFPDCIYRTDGNSNPLITKEEDLYQSIPSHQLYLVEYISELLNRLPPDVILVSPLSIGNHIDHRIVRAAVDHLTHKKILFYKDYPYHVKEIEGSDLSNIGELEPVDYKITQTNFKNWIKAIKCHKSQISTFWKDEEALTKEIINYAKAGGGKSLYLIGETSSFT
ncbi:MAG: hypothetical protein CL609_07160 [Anaerolineaceae bacterium]|nr:hypothetical protein [Anaerolineaceae bacterium]